MMEAFRVSVICGLCGIASEQWTADSPKPKEAPDFDTRPGEPLRSTLPVWVQRCPRCNYCADSIASIHEKAVDFVRSEDYQNLWTDAGFLEKSREFMCYSAILSHVGQHADAGWAALHAAWACDDENDRSGAIIFRERAIAHWQRGKKAGQSFSDDLATEYSLVTDLYRRSCLFEAAVVTCSEALDMEDLPPMLEQLLRREKSLIDRKDPSRHSVRELLQ
jgi:hypothetical protein